MRLFLLAFGVLVGTASSQTTECNLFGDASRSQWTCDLDEYCNAYPIDHTSISCTGELNGTHAAQYQTRHCYETFSNTTKVCFDESSSFEFQEYTWTAVDQNVTFTDGFDFSFQVHYDMCNSSPCACQVALRTNGGAYETCNSCQVCFDGRSINGDFWLSLDCNNIAEGLTRTCSTDYPWDIFYAKVHRHYHPRSDIGCDILYHRLNGELECGLDQYCAYQSAITGMDFTCEGDTTDGVYSFQNSSTICTEKGDPQLGDYTPCANATNTYRFKGLSTLETSVSSTFVSVFDGVDFELDWIHCQDDESQACGCRVSVAGEVCQNCEVCDTTTDGNLDIEFECASSGVKRTCGVGNWGDFLAQAYRLDNPESSLGCDFEKHREYGELECSVEQYCKEINRDSNDAVLCQGDIAGSFSIAHERQECYGPSPRGNDNVCADYTETVSYDGLTQLGTQHNYAYSSVYSMNYVLETTLCDGSEDQQCFCRVAMDAMDCRSCTVCDEGKPVNENYSYQFDCGNLARGLRKPCDASLDVFLFNADREIQKLEDTSGESSLASVDGNGNNGVVIGSVVGALVLAAAIAGALMLFRRRKPQGRQEPKDQNPTDSNDEDWLGGNVRAAAAAPNHPEPVATAVRIHAVPLNAGQTYKENAQQPARIHAVPLNAGPTYKENFTEARQQAAQHNNATHQQQAQVLDAGQVLPSYKDQLLSAQRQSR